MPSWYTPERDGTLEQYLETYNGRTVDNSFKGWAHYKILWDAGYLSLGITSLRLNWSHDRYDEHFVVLGEHEIEGIQLPAHSGRPGIHDPEKILDETGAPHFSIYDFNPDPR